MAGSGIWLDDATYLQQQGQIWAQQHLQQLQAGQDWAQQAMASTMRQLQSMVPAVSAPAAPQPAAPPSPPPVAQPVPTPTPVPAPVAVQPAPPVTPTPAIGTIPGAPQAPVPQAPTPSSDMTQAGQNWAQQQIDRLLNPDTSVAPQTAQPVPPATTSPATPAGPQNAISGPITPDVTASDRVRGQADAIGQASTNTGVPASVIAGIMDTEAGGPQSVSPAGAKGFMQVMPQHFQPGDDPFDPVTNIQRGAEVLADNYKRYGSWDKAAAAYFGAIDSQGNILGSAQDVRGTTGSSYVSQFLSNLQHYKDMGLDGAGQAVQDVVQKGQTAVNTAAQGVQSAVARVSQFAMGLSSGDAMAFCGPAAALAFAQTYGRNPTVDEAKKLAQSVGWNPDQGMAGVGSEVNLLKAIGVDAHATSGVDWAQVGRDASGGNPVIIDTPGHYYYIDGYNTDSGKFHVGTSGTDLKGGSEWMSADQINAMPQSQGAARAAIFADHPLAQNDGQAQSVAAQPAQQPLYMGTMQPAASTQNKAQDVMSAVQDVGGGLPDITGALSPRATDLTSMLTPQSSRPTVSPSRDLGADLPDITGLLTVAPTTPLGRVVSGTPIGQLSPSDQAQALMQWNQQYELARATGMQNLTGNLPVVSGLASFATDPEQILALAGGGALGSALLPGGGLLANMGRQALTGGLSGGLYGAQQPSATPQNIALNAVFGGGLGALGAAGGAGFGRLLGRGATTELPGVLQNLARPAEGEPLQYSARGIALDPLTGQEMLPAEALQYSPRGIALDASGQELVPTDVLGTSQPTNRLAQAMSANPEATQFMRTTENQFEPIIPQAPMESDELLTALRSMLQGRESGEVNAALARALGGGAAGGLTAYQTTDENDPNRWLKVAGGVGAGALAAGPGVDLAMQLASNPAVRAFVTDEGGGLDLQRVRQLIGAAPIGRTIQAARIGSLAGGIPTLTHIALNMPVQVGLKLANDLPAAIATGHFEAAPMEVYGALQGLRSWALNAANELRQPGPYAQALGGGTGAQVAEAGLTGLVRLHPVLQDMAGQMATQMDLWSSAAKAATDAGLSRFSPAWNAEVARLVGNPTADMTASATAAGERASLNTPSGTTGAAVSRLVQSSPLAKFFLPIWQKGYAIATQGIETSPLGLAGTAWDVARAAVGQGPYAGAEGFAGRGAAGAVTPLAQRIRNNVIGIGLAYVAYKEAEQGNITGEGPSDPAEQAALRATGWQPDSIRIGGRYFDAHLLGPVGWALVQGANAYEATQGVGGAGLKPIDTPQGQRAPNALDIAGDLVARQARYFNNETFLSSLGSALNLIGSSKQQGEVPAREAASLLESLIPQGALLSNLASTTDPYQRIAQGATPLEQIQRSVESRLPGARQSLPPRLDVTGQPIPNPQQGPGLLLPRSTVINPNPVALAMAGVGVTPSAAPKDIPYGPMAKVVLTPDEQQQWTQYRGDLVEQATAPLVNSPEFAQMDTNAQKMALAYINQVAADAANKMVLRDIATGPGAGTSRMIGTGALAPVYGYAPIGMGDQLTQTMMLRNQMHHQALMNALLGGQSGVQASLASLAA